MNIIYLLIPFALFLGASFLFAFIKMAKDGQYDDLETPAQRMLLDDEVLIKKGERKNHV